MKQKIKFIPPVGFSDAQSYFKNFFVTNKISNSQFSYRLFAKLIGWPPSYLSDLVAGRKNLTVERAFEFANYFKMNNLNKEHMLWLALANTHKNNLDTFLQQKSKVNPNASLYQSEAVLDETLLFDVIWVLQILTWQKKKLTVDELLATFEIPGFTADRLMRALDKIEKENYLEWSNDGRLCGKNDKAHLPTAFDHSDTKGDPRYQGIKLHSYSTANFLHYINYPHGPSTYHTRPVVIPKGQFLTVAMKMIDLRNWMDELSNQHMAQSEDPSKDSHLMQLDLNLFPLTKKP